MEKKFPIIPNEGKNEFIHGAIQNVKNSAIVKLENRHFKNVELTVELELVERSGFHESFNREKFIKTSAIDIHQRMDIENRLNE